MRRAWLGAALLAVGMVGAMIGDAYPSAARAEAAVPHRAIDPTLGIQNLDHLIFIVQENSPDGAVRQEEPVIWSGG